MFEKVFDFLGYVLPVLFLGGLAEAQRGDLLEWFFGVGSPSAPSHFWIALSSTDPGAAGAGITEPSGGAYGRKECSSWALSGATMSNNAAITFTESSAAWLASASIPYFAIYDAETAGNFLGRGTITTPRTVDAAGITLSFATGELDVTISETWS